MKCKECGTEIHPQAELCWKCGHFVTPDAEKREKEFTAHKTRFHEAQLRKFELDLRTEFDAYAEAETTSEGGPILFTNEIKDLITSFRDEIELTPELAAQLSRRPRAIKTVISWMREFAGEEPEPAVLTPTIKQLIASVFWRLSLFPALIVVILLMGVEAHGILSYCFLFGIFGLILFIPIMQLAQLRTLAVCQELCKIGSELSARRGMVSRWNLTPLTTA